MCSAAASANQIIGEGATLVLLQHALFQLSALDTTPDRFMTLVPDINTTFRILRSATALFTYSELSGYSY